MTITSTMLGIIGFTMWVGTLFLVWLYLELKMLNAWRKKNERNNKIV